MKKERSNENFQKTFKDLGIKVDPLPENYTPDEFGWSLTHGSSKNQGYSISYSSNTILEKKN